ncbi:diguanylate cyclase [Mycolicibacterium sp. CH28]|uniref:sensor domain-containing diguanylate cyclase n=1 Tax=Mycolicibacterium sp. CH28 TaxID=2512237 RepID=UPI00107FD4BA|nr:diguanylate cyclase [Mycolicibacterium sp. CH28]TGD85029.1 diguanylate cyclase [Mycolicibacterium sp. CH28]
MGTSDGPPDARWFEAIANGSTTVFFVLRVQPDLAFEYLNDAIEAQIGCSVADGLADPKSVLGQVDADHADRLAEALALPPGNSTVLELTWQHHEGRPVHARTWVRSREREDGSVVLEGSTRDITALHEAETELRQSEERYRLLAENAWEIIWTASVDGKVTYVSPAVERMRGYSVHEAMRQTVDEIYPPDAAADVRSYFHSLHAAIRDHTKQLPVLRAEYESYRKDGSIMVGEMQVIPHLDQDGRVLEILGVTRDVSERKKFEAELTRLAVTDPVTGVWNRRHGEELLRADLVPAGRQNQSLSLLMLDIDWFKSINDSYGHQAGDSVLVEIARRLVRKCRSTDMVARWGGEEFVILLRDCTLWDGAGIAEKIRADIANVPFSDVGTVSVSIGVAQLNPRDDLTSWVARADGALYAAKRSGRNTVCTAV